MDSKVDFAPGSVSIRGFYCSDKNVSSDEDTEVCVTEWIDAPKGKPVTCPFLKLSPGKREEMKFMFDVTKCDKLFDVCRTILLG
jgi:hypothetical protein